MILADAGPLIALVNKREVENHARCVEILHQTRNALPLLTTWPCITEAMYLTYKSGKWRAQKALWNLIEAGTVKIHLSNHEEQARMIVLMEKWRDRPMDLADASLVTAAEFFNINRIFTLDQDFTFYRLYDKTPFDVIS